jgi:hypothetical protein
MAGFVEGATFLSSPLLRPVLNPGQADTLVHLCGRARQSEGHAAETVLSRILDEGRIRASCPYGARWPFVSFTEGGPDGVQALLAAGLYQPWGLVVTRDWAYQRGGGPAWYARTEVYRDIRAKLSDRESVWLVRTEPGTSDWLHEREWRVPCEPDFPYLDLHYRGPVALVVASEEWEPSPKLMWEVDRLSGEYELAVSTPSVALVPRWLWTGLEFRPLPPISPRLDFIHWM